MAVPENAKKPQDRKKGKDESAYKAGELFTFEVDGEDQTLKDPAEVITPGFIRKNRNAGAVEMTYQALELLCTDEQLDAIDSMSWAENRKFLERFDSYIGTFFEVSMGE